MSVFRESRSYVSDSAIVMFTLMIGCFGGDMLVIIANGQDWCPYSSLATLGLHCMVAVIIHYSVETGNYSTDRLWTVCMCLLMTVGLYVGYSSRVNINRPIHLE